MDMHSVNRWEGCGRACAPRWKPENDLVLLGHLPEKIAMTAEMLPLENPASLRADSAGAGEAARELLPLEVIGSAGTPGRRAGDCRRLDHRGAQRGQPPAAAPRGEQTEIAVITVRPVNLTPADTSTGEQILLAEAVRVATSAHLRLRNRLSGVGCRGGRRCFTRQPTPTW